MELIGRQIGLRSRIAGHVGSWWRRKAELVHLRELDGHLLKDIGLSSDDMGSLRRSRWP